MITDVRTVEVVFQTHPPARERPFDFNGSGTGRCFLGLDIFFARDAVLSFYSYIIQYVLS